MKQQFLKDKTDTIRLTVYQTNRAVIPTSATIVLKKPGGATLQASDTASIDSTTGEMTYSLTATHTATLDLNYIAEWAYVVSGVTYYETQLFDVVRSRLSVPVVDGDLFDELETLRLANAQATGTATSATTSTLVDTARRKETDDYWKGGTVEILDGTGENQKRTITGFTQSSSTLNVTPNFVTTPDTTSVYRVTRSFSTKILQAYEEFETMLYNKGRRHQLILESSQIRQPLIYLTLEKICRELSDEEGDKWDILKKDYVEKFRDFFTNMTLDYDRDDSGTIDDSEEQTGVASLWIGRA